MRTVPEIIDIPSTADGGQQTRSVNNPLAGWNIQRNLITKIQ